MAGHSDPHIFYTSNYPGTALSYEAVAIDLLNAGWPRNKKVLTTAVAIAAAESGRKEKAFLAYIDLGVDRNSPEGLALRAKIAQIPKDTSLTTYRYKIKELGAKLVRTDTGLFQIGKTFVDPWPYEWGEKLTPEWSVTQLMTGQVNAKEALQLWKTRKWQPWATYTHVREGDTEPAYKRFWTHAAEGVEAALAETGPE